MTTTAVTLMPLRCLGVTPLTLRWKGKTVTSADVVRACIYWTFTGPTPIVESLLLLFQREEKEKAKNLHPFFLLQNSVSFGSVYTQNCWLIQRVR